MNARPIILAARRLRAGQGSLSDALDLARYLRARNRARLRPFVSPDVLFAPSGAPVVVPRDPDSPYLGERFFVPGPLAPLP